VLISQHLTHEERAAGHLKQVVAAIHEVVAAEATDALFCSAYRTKDDQGLHFPRYRFPADAIADADHVGISSAAN
jgi:hypothetical protein